MTANYCKTCRFFSQNQNIDIGSCRRYPTYQNRHGTEWCGEYTQAHFDLPDTIENLVIAEEKKEQAIIEKPERNKGGRPRKVTRV